MNTGYIDVPTNPHFRNFVRSVGLASIDYMTRMKTKANNDFEKVFYKLMNNSVIGKTMEHIRNRQNVRLAATREQAEKLINKPSFKRVEIFTDNFCAVHLNREYKDG